MNLLTTILFFNLIGSIFSLLGALVLMAKRDFLERYSHFLSSFAAGTLLGAAFFELIPEAIEHGEESGIDVYSIMIWTLGGILFFFLIERLLHWFHHHSFDPHEIGKKPIIPLIIGGDTLHNFIDGVAIASSFMISVPLGIATTFAVGAHEIPQEIGDFGVLIKNGMSKFKALRINVLSALSSFIGALLAFFLGKSIEGLLPFFISISVGFFLYIALSDLIPEIHHESKKRIAFAETIFLLFGVSSIYLVLIFLDQILNIAH